LGFSFGASVAKPGKWLIASSSKYNVTPNPKP